MSRRPAKVDYLRVYPGLNDISDALEAMPLEMVRHFTLLKEIDAKCTSTAPELSRDITDFLATSKTDPARERKLQRVRQLLQEIMPCLEEKMHVASMAADAMGRHMERIDADYQLIVDHEIPKNIKIDPNNPALSEILPPDKPAASRSEARREAIAARKAAAAAAATASESQASRQSTPVSLPARRGKPRNGLSYPPTTNSNPPPERLPTKRRREDDDADDDEPVVQLSSRRHRGPDKDEPVYCYCEQGSYGDMVGCDGPDCKREWFHLGCIGLSASPKGQWFCEDCQAKLRVRR